MEHLISKVKEKMNQSTEVFQKELMKLRTGKATPVLLEPVQVEYYGSKVPLQQVANISIADAKTIVIAPWEAQMIAAVEKAILAANLGFTPQTDGKVIRIFLPPLTQQRREEMVRVIKKITEEARVSIRNHRREANEVVKKEEKNGLSEDEAKKHLNLIQKQTDQFIQKIDAIMEKKEKEIMTI